MCGRAEWLAVLPVPDSNHATGAHAGFFEATDNLQQLCNSAHESPNGALATGPHSGIVILEVGGGEGLASLFDLCGDDWRWLDTLRSVAGEKPCIFFTWPQGRRQNIGSGQIGEALSVLGEGDWLLVPREPPPNECTWFQQEHLCVGFDDTLPSCRGHHVASSLSQTRS